MSRSRAGGGPAAVDVAAESCPPKAHCRPSLLPSSMLLSTGHAQSAARSPRLLPLILLHRATLWRPPPPSRTACPTFSTTPMPTSPTASCRWVERGRTARLGCPACMLPPAHACQLPVGCCPSAGSAATPCMRQPHMRPCCGPCSGPLLLPSHWAVSSTFSPAAARGGQAHPLLLHRLWRRPPRLHGERGTAWDRGACGCLVPCRLVACCWLHSSVCRVQAALLG